MRTLVHRAILAAFVTVFGIEASVFAQPPAAGPPQPRRLTADEAVELALANNLGIQIARFAPQIEDLGIAQARGGWVPTVTTSLQHNSAQSPPNSFLSGAQETLTNTQLSNNTSLQQLLPWGGRYTIGWDSTRSTTNSFFANFNPQLRSALSVSYQQPLLRGFGIDSTRQQLEVNRKNREIADLDLREAIVATTRAVRRAYWDLAYAIASLEVQRQSLDLARESLRNTRARVEIGTTPPIEIIEAESEVALREEAVIVAQANIATAEDALRALVFDPSAPDFWTIRIEPSEPPPFRPAPVDVDAAVRTALERRTDLQRARKNLEAADINIRFLRNQTLPDVTASVDYGLTGLGGVQFVRGAGGFPGPIIGQTERNFGTVLSDLLRNEYPTWTASISISYPIGGSSQDASLARARLQHSQTQAQIRNQQLQIATQVRQAARQVLTNQQRVESTRAARQLAERRLEAEQRKFAAGTSTSFFVFQAQRDLAVARNNELRAILDYNQSLVDLETVQEVPLR